MSAVTSRLDEQIFIALQTYEQIKCKAMSTDTLAESEPASAPRLSFNDIVCCVKSPDSPLSKARLSIINQSLDYRRQYRFVLVQISICDSPSQIAAGSQPQIFRRDDDQFLFAVETIDKNEVLLEVTLVQGGNAEFGADDNKPVYLHGENDKGIEVLMLNPTSASKFAVALAPDDPQLQVFTHVNSHLYVTH